MNDMLSKKDVSIHVDYMSFTFPIESENHVLDAFEELKEELAELFYCDKTMFGESRFAQDGYKYQYTLGVNIIIRFGGESTKMKKVLDVDNKVLSTVMYDSINVELKGSACREIEKYSDYKVDYIKILKYFLFEKGGRCKRFDIAIDDLKGSDITMQNVYNKIKRKEYTSKFKNDPFCDMTLDDTADFKDKSMSIYFGKPNGNHMPELQLCIYNKKAERKFNNDTYEGNYWVRYELRYRGDKSDELAYYLIQTELKDIGRFASEQLKYILELKKKPKKSKDNQVYRWPVLPSWEIFLGVVRGSKFSTRPTGKSSIDKKIAWRDFTLTRQNILLGMCDAYNNDNINYYLDPLIGEVVHNLESQYNYLLEHEISVAELQMVNNYLKDKGVDKRLTKDDIYLYLTDLQKRIEYFNNSFTLPF